MANNPNDPNRPQGVPQGQQGDVDVDDLLTFIDQSYASMPTLDNPQKREQIRRILKEHQQTQRDPNAAANKPFDPNRRS